MLYEVITTLFGKDRVYDYSGSNDITADYHNYYELSHYRPSVSARILRDIYSRGKSNGKQKNSYNFV